MMMSNYYSHTHSHKINTIVVFFRTDFFSQKKNCIKTINKCAAVPKFIEVCRQIFCLCP